MFKRGALLPLLLLAIGLGARPARATLDDVRLNEFLASNDSIFPDEDGDFDDWVELYNAGTDPVDLGGSYLTDNAGNLTKWQFPSTVLPAGGYLVVFASNKNRAVSGAPLHTNFALSKGGEYLGLVKPDGATIVSQFAPEFPPQVTDISYGIDPTGQPNYLATPTPDAANAAAIEVVLDLSFSAERGFYDAPFDLTISTPTSGAQIRYTTDGSLPTATHGTVYDAAIPISTTTTLQAAAFKSGAIPTTPITHTYIFLDDVLKQTGAGFPAHWGSARVDYAVDPTVVNSPAYSGEIKDDLKAVPTVSIVANLDDLFGRTRGIWSNPTLRDTAGERPVSTELIYPNGQDGFQINCAIRIEGRSSRTRTNPKHSIHMLFDSDYGPSRLDFPVFPDTPVHRFKGFTLRQGWQEGWLFAGKKALYVNDQFAHETQLAMGQVSSHGLYVHVYLNGLYWGMYDLIERPSATFAASYYGGSEGDWDVIKENTVSDGDRAAWDTLLSLANSNLQTLSGYAAIQQYLDVPNLIDYMLMNFYIGNIDWNTLNWYSARLRAPGEGFKFFSWDAERSFDSLRRNVTAVNFPASPSTIHASLARYSPEYRLLFADHVHRHMFNGGALTAAVATARFNSLTDHIDAPIVGESARWGDAKRPHRPYTRDVEWDAQRQLLLSGYFPQRSAVVLDQLRKVGLYPAIVAPEFSQQGGQVPQGFALTIVAPAGTIYYTTDGSDPRLPGGAIAPSALVYGAAIPINANVTVNARARDTGGNWSALDEAAFLVQVAQPLRITELMYHPAPPFGTFTEDDFEYVEFKNVGLSSIDLTGVTFAQAIVYTFPSITLPAGAHLVLARNPTALATRYDLSATIVAGPYTGKLSNSGEEVQVNDASGATLLDFTYSQSWYPSTDGGGYSLTVIDPLVDPTTLSNASSWRASNVLGGSPGYDD